MSISAKAVRSALFLARFFFVLCHVISTPARPLLFQPWAAPPQYALLNAVSLSLHSVLMATAISTSAWLITAVGSWRLVYGMLSVFFLVQTLVWWRMAREDKAPIQGLKHALEASQETSLRALRTYPQGWFLPTLLLEQRGMPPGQSVPLLGCFVLRANSVRPPWRGARKTGHAPSAPPLDSGVL
jgi:hypothetical protein